MPIILLLLFGYLGIGLLFLVVFQLTTHRIGKRLADVVADVQTRLMSAGGTMVSPKVAVVITLLYAWIAWVFVLFSYIMDEHDRKQEKK